MEINAVTTCFHYAHYFKFCVGNRKHFKRWVVVTLEDDKETIELCEQNDIEYIFADKQRLYNYQSNLRKGTAINKGLNYIYEYGSLDWYCHIDSDIVLPDNFTDYFNKPIKLNDDYARYSEIDLNKRNLYSLNRLDVTLSNTDKDDLFNERIKEAFYNMNLYGFSGKQGNLGWGYFQLFHMTSLRQNYQSLRPFVYPEMSCNAGLDDLLFTKLFHQVKCFDNINCIHLSPQAQNWDGNKVKKLLDR